VFYTVHFFLFSFFFALKFFSVFFSYAGLAYMKISCGGAVAISIKFLSFAFK